ncbi:MAG: MaoC family dehydratase [Minwuia sp.]|uniref:MaoC family dehydratase n=1 Tax=Minwuia sp. TaxID=2493630 RepID=UPI003A84B5F3
MSAITEKGKTWYLDQMEVGMTAEYTDVVTEERIQAFADASGDDNPLHLDEDYAKTTMFKGRIAHGMLSGSFLSTIFGTIFPGPGGIYLSQNMKFVAPVRVGDKVTARAEIDEVLADKGRVHFTCTCSVDGKNVIVGDAWIMPPRRKS